MAMHQEAPARWHVPLDRPVRASAPMTPSAAALAAGAVVAIVLLLFWPTTASMIEIWRHSDTFQHCFLVVPIALWLIWGERARLAATSLRPFWPGLLALGAAGAAWTFGQLASAQVISHFALIAMVPAVIATVFGFGWLRVLWFPLAFLFFAVPFGEALVPLLMDWTADFTVAAMRLSGVPVYREGMHFVIPSGNWSVIEACSGIKFLIASLMAGSLYAWLMYRSPARRLGFMVASIVVPLLANWLRAYAIVMIGHISNNRLMTNEDHIVFGWILFGAIMLLMYWLGARWREDQAAAPAGPAIARWSSGTVGAAAAALLMLVAWPPLAAALMRPASDAAPGTFVLPQAAGSWRLVPSPATEWTPEIDGATESHVLTFERDGHLVQLFVAVFRNQTQAAQIATASNQMVRTTSERWKQVTLGSTPAPASGGALPAHVRGAEVRRQRGPEQLLAWQWYYSGQRATTSGVQAKLDLALARLLRRPDTALWIAAATPVTADRAAAQRTLEDFAQQMGPALAAAFAETVRR